MIGPVRFAEACYSVEAGIRQLDALQDSRRPAQNSDDAEIEANPIYLHFIAEHEGERESGRERGRREGRLLTTFTCTTERLREIGRGLCAEAEARGITRSEYLRLGREMWTEAFRDLTRRFVHARQTVESVHAAPFSSDPDAPSIETELFDHLLEVMTMAHVFHDYVDVMMGSCEGTR